MKHLSNITIITLIAAICLTTVAITLYFGPLNSWYDNLTGRSIATLSSTFTPYTIDPYGRPPRGDPTSDCDRQCDACTQYCAKSKYTTIKSQCMSTGYVKCKDGSCVNDANKCPKDCAERFGAGSISCPAGKNSDQKDESKCCAAGDSCNEVASGSVCSLKNNAICCPPGSTVQVIDVAICSMAQCVYPANTCESKDPSTKTCGQICCSATQTCARIPTFDSKNPMYKCVDADNSCDAATEFECVSHKDTSGASQKVCCKNNVETCEILNDLASTLSKYCKPSTFGACTGDGQSYCSGTGPDFSKMAICCSKGTICSPSPDGRAQCR